jgi:nitroreductase
VQDWEFVLVKTPEGKNALAAAAFNQSFVSNAHVVAVVCSDLDKITKAYGERGRTLYSVQNTSAAVENLMLAAWDRGIGTCWIGAFNEQKVKDALVLPTSVRPLAIITMGYPAQKPMPTKRRPVEETLHWETF